MANRTAMVLSLCFAGAMTLTANAQQMSSPEKYKLHREIQLLHDQERDLVGKIRTSQEQIQPLYDQIRQLSSQIRPLRLQAERADTALHAIRTKIADDEKKLRSN